MLLYDGRIAQSCANYLLDIQVHVVCRYMVPGPLVADTAETLLFQVVHNHARFLCKRKE